MKAASIALVGDYDPAVTAHQAIPKALDLASAKLQTSLQWTWVGTDSIASPDALTSFDAIWCVPASPYKNMDGALSAIRHARENKLPFLGTCGGFQHAVVEYARNALGISEADHAESNADAAFPVITPLVCALKEQSGRVHFAEGSALREIYGQACTTEGYRCSYGMNPSFENLLADADMKISARDEEGGVRAIELAGHPFFFATLFQPERAALASNNNPLIDAFAAAACGMRRLSV